VGVGVVADEDVYIVHHLLAEVGVSIRGDDKG